IDINGSNDDYDDCDSTNDWQDECDGDLYCGYCYIKNSAQSIDYSSVRDNGECTGYIGSFIIFMYNCGTVTRKVIAKIMLYASCEMERSSNCYGNDDDCCWYIKSHFFLLSVYLFNLT